jgi:hypothetical protein
MVFDFEELLEYLNLGNPGGGTRERKKRCVTKMSDRERERDEVSTLTKQIQSTQQPQHSQW